MTGFGRTGTWFGDGPLPPCGRTSSWRPRAPRPGTGRSGSWRRRGGGVRRGDRAPAAFVHGFTYSAPARGAATVAREVLRILEAEALVEASERPRASGSWSCCGTGWEAIAAVGDIRGRGLMVGVELVRDRDTGDPWPRAAKLVEGRAPDRARTRPAALLGDRRRERRRRRRRPDRAAVRDHGCGAGADRRRPRRGAGSRAGRDRRRPVQGSVALQKKASRQRRVPPVSGGCSRRAQRGGSPPRGESEDDRGQISCR